MVGETSARCWTDGRRPCQVFHCLLHNVHLASEWLPHTSTLKDSEGLLSYNPIFNLKFASLASINAVIDAPMNRLLSSGTERYEGAPKIVYSDPSSKERKLITLILESSRRCCIDLSLSCGDKTATLLGAGLVKCTCPACSQDKAEPHRSIMKIEVRNLNRPCMGKS